jgi:transposase-like protein
MGKLASFGQPAVANLRWPDSKPICPKCAHREHYYLKTQRRWKYKSCSRQFSVKQGTIFEDSPIGLDKWLAALWMLVNCKNSVSAPTKWPAYILHL